MSYRLIYEEIKKILKKEFPEEKEFYLEKPLIEEYGDVASTICFKVAKKMKKKPFDIANEKVKNIKKILKTYPLIKEIKAINGYLNFYINYELFTKYVINEILSKRKNYGKIDIGKGKKVIIEHTNTNPNKAIHIGHSRNTCLGDSLSRILKFTNHKVLILNYIDDTGSQMADLILGFKKLNFPIKTNIRFDKYCGDFVYVKVNEMYEKNPELLKEKQKIAHEIDLQETENSKISKKIAERVLKEQIKTCERLKAYFDLINWESDIIKFSLLKETLKILEEKGIILKEKEGKFKDCIVIKSHFIKGHEKETDKVLIKSDGSATYLAKDIAYAFWKLGLIEDKFKYKLTKYGEKLLFETSKNGNIKRKFVPADLVINVIDIRQTRLQDIIKSIISYVSGFEYEKKYIHYKYELVALSNAASKILGFETKSKIVHMSGRKGIYFNTDDILEKLKEKIKQFVKKNNPDKSEKWIEEISEKIAVSALRYALLKLDNNKILIFDFNETLKLEGDSGVYVLYTYVRTKGILNKAKEIKIQDYSGYSMNETEIKLVKIMARFEEVVKNASINLQPQIMILYLKEICDIFNSYYEKYPVINSENPARSFRIKLVECISQVLENAMNLIGMIPIEKM